jgi:glycosyltransferase
VKNNFFEIAKTINSLHSQQFKNFEHIIIDANSHDGTSQIIKKKINSKIKYYRGPDAGIYDAINKGINFSRGQYVGILHAGDFFSSTNILSEINRCIKKYDIFFGNIIFFDKKINILRYWKKSLINLHLYNAYRIPHTGMFIKRKVFQEVGGYSVDYKISSDTDFILRLCKKKYKIFYLDKVILYMKNGGVSSSYKSFTQKAREDLFIYFNYFGILFFVIYLFKVLSKVFDFAIFQNTLLLKNDNKILKREYKKLNK